MEKSLHKRTSLKRLNPKIRMLDTPLKRQIPNNVLDDTMF